MTIKSLWAAALVASIVGSAAVAFAVIQSPTPTELCSKPEVVAVYKKLTGEGLDSGLRDREYARAESEYMAQVGDPPE